MRSDVQRKMLSGAMWMVLFKFVERSLGFVSLLILVRVLSPSDFGIVAMATSFIYMAELLTAFGFDIALIQRRDASEAHYHTAWTCNVLLGLLITTLTLASASLIASFYNEPKLFMVVCTLAIGSLIAGCENIGVVAFRKDLQFRREFAFQISRKIVGFLVVVPLAYYLRSYWALVAGILTSKFAGTMISYLSHPFRPKFSLAKVHGLLNFSKWLLLNNVFGFLKERSSDFFIGRMLGAPSLGVYNVSYEVATMPTTELSAPVNRALMPGFSRIADDHDLMRAVYGNALRLLAVIAVPAAVGIFAVAPLAFPTLLGSKWLDGVPLIEILAINGGLLLFHSSICAVIVASGHPDRVAVTNGLYVFVLLALFAIAIPGYGLRGAAFAALSTSVVCTPAYLWQVRRSVGVPSSIFVGALARPAIAATIMAVAVRWVLPVWAPGLATAVSVGWLAAGIALGIVCYVSAISVLWVASGRPAGAERAIFDSLKARYAKFAAGRRSTEL